MEYFLSDASPSGVVSGPPVTPTPAQTDAADFTAVADQAVAQAAPVPSSPQAPPASAQGAAAPQAAASAPATVPSGTEPSQGEALPQIFVPQPLEPTSPSDAGYATWPPPSSFGGGLRLGSTAPPTYMPPQASRPDEHAALEAHIAEQLRSRSQPLPNARLDQTSLALIDPSDGTNRAIDVTDPGSVARALNTGEEDTTVYGDTPNVELLQDFTSSTFVSPGMFGMMQYDRSTALVAVEHADGSGRWDVRVEYLGLTGNEGRLTSGIKVGTLDHKPTADDFSGGSELNADVAQAFADLHDKANVYDIKRPRDDRHVSTHAKDVVAGTGIQFLGSIPATLASVVDMTGDMIRDVQMLGHNGLMAGKMMFGQGMSLDDISWREEARQARDDSWAPADAAHNAQNAAADAFGIDREGPAWTTVAPIASMLVPARGAAAASVRKAMPDLVPTAPRLAPQHLGLDPVAAKNTHMTSGPPVSLQLDMSAPPSLLQTQILSMQPPIRTSLPAAGQTSSHVSGRQVNPLQVEIVRRGADEPMPAPDDFNSPFHQLTRHIQGQLGGVRTDEMAELLATNPTGLPAAEYATVAQKLVQFGDLEGFDALTGTLRTNGPAGDKRILTTSESELGNSLRYFQKRGMIDSEGRSPMFYQGTGDRLAGKSGYYILDELGLQKLEGNEAMRQAVADSDLTLIYPRGMSLGTTPFRPLNADELKAQVEAVATDVEALMARDGLSFEAALDQRLTGPVAERLDALGLLRSDGSNFFSLDNPAANSLSPDMLAEHTRTQSFALENAGRLLAHVHRDKRQDAVHALEDNLYILSPDRIRASTDLLYREIEFALGSRGLPTDTMHIVVPSPVKSYSVMAQSFANINGITGDRIIPLHRTGEMPADAALIILDDMVGSGQSLEAVIKKMRSSFGFEGPIFTGSLLTSTQGMDTLGRLSRQDKLYWHLTADLIFPPLTKDKYNAMDPADIERLSVFFDGGYRNTGQGGLGIFSALTGTPDNNARFFSHPELVENLSLGNSKATYGRNAGFQNFAEPVAERILGGRGQAPAVLENPTPRPAGGRGAAP